MKFAVIQTGGKQYKVREGDTIEIERLKASAVSSEVVFEKVLLVADDGKVQLGSPTLTGVVVKGVLQAEVRGPKIRVMKFKSKVRHRRVTGHRQKHSQVLIQSIGEGKKVALKTEEKAKTKAKRATRKKNE
ncbi:MAG: 50S ribosomal protein L21 [bacterium]|nr:50S ribosomal protein L21 [bacterium]